MKPLYNHQRNGVLRGIEANGIHGFFHDPGCGKTRTCLELYRHYKERNPSLKLLVVCPLSLIKAAWGEDIAEFTGFSYIPFKKLKSVMPDVIGINYEALISKKNLPVLKDLLRRHDWMCVLDESCRLQNHKSITTKTLISMREMFKYRVVCTGTPRPNCDCELWGQISFLAGDVLPKSFFAFRNSYFHLERNGQIFSGSVYGRGALQMLVSSGWKYGITDAKRKHLMDSISPYTDWVKKEDVLDLPEKVTEIRDVFLSPAETKAYKQMEKDLITEINDTEITAPVALAKYMKLRQATSGFMYDEHHNVCAVGTSKLSELKNVLLELGKQPVIIWIQFHAEFDAIKNLLEKMGKSYTYLTAAQKHKDEAIVDFQENKVQYLIAHPKSAGHGLTFVNCCTAIFYSVDYSFKAHIQAKDRIHRIGQVNRCLYVYLLASGTIDHVIMDVLRGKHRIQDIVMQIVKGGVK